MTWWTNYHPNYFDREEFDEPEEETMKRDAEELRARIVNASIPEPNTGCWLWLLTCNQKGYPRISIRSRQESAHRVSYAVFNGQIPAGLEIDHTCKVRCCVNPGHLEVVTHKENIRRGDCSRIAAQAKSAKAKANPLTQCPKGHPYTGANVRLDRRGYKICVTCNIEKGREFRARQRLKRELAA